MFEIGDKVVYGVVGVCEVENIDTPPIKGISGDYYFLQPVFDSKGIIYSPVDSNKVMIRSIMTVKECDKLKERARNCKKDGELSEKVTPMQYDEHMKSQDALKLMHLIRALYVIKNERAESITLIGVCTDICVISNAMILKAFFPDKPIIVDAACCAGSTPEGHKNALAVMKTCQIQIENEE